MKQRFLALVFASAGALGACDIITGPTPPDPNYGVTVVGPDPCPTCVGVYLAQAGNTWTSCTVHMPYGDADDDAIDDGCESEVAIAFAPHLYINTADGDSTRESYFAVKRSPLGGQSLQILYMLGYHRDVGTRIVGGVHYNPHYGDSEFILLTVLFDSYTKRWRLVSAVLSAHYEAPLNYDQTRTYPWEWLYYIRTDGSVDYGTLRRAPIVYVAKNKHANYPDVGTCNYSQDDCSGTLVLSRVKDLGSSFTNRNIGSRSSPMLDCVGSVLPNMYRGQECFWTNVWRFTGWYMVNEGATPYSSILADFGW